MEAAEDMLSSLDAKRMEARRDKVTAHRHLAEARTRQRDAVNALADARRGSTRPGSPQTGTSSAQPAVRRAAVALLLLADQVKPC